MGLSAHDITALMPFASLAVLPILFMLLLLFIKAPTIKLMYGPVICILGVYAAALNWLAKEGTAFNGLIFTDSFAVIFHMLILFGTFFVFLLSDGQWEQQRVKPTIDVTNLILFSALGGLVMVSAADLIVMFLGFELLSICVYALCGIAKGEKASSESALKYFVLGAFSSAFLLYGIALVYGATGTTNLSQIAEAGLGDNLLMSLGLGLILFGFAFKVSLVPFHFWTPDVYQGAPVSIATFMAVVVKLAAFGGFLRILVTGFFDLVSLWEGFIWVLCILSMTGGNLMALRQRSVKRMLAYSSIAHAGYTIIGFLVVDTAGGGEAAIFYLFAYTLMTIASFGVVLLVTGGSPEQYGEDDLRAFKGIGWTHPFLGLAMSIAMLSLAGMPPFIGFMGKFYLFSAAVRGGFVGLAIIAALNSVISLYYYLRVLVVMYFETEREVKWVPKLQNAAGPLVSIALVSLGILAIGIFPQAFMQLAKEAIKNLL